PRDRLPPVLRVPLLRPARRDVPERARPTHVRDPREFAPGRTGGRNTPRPDLRARHQRPRRAIRNRDRLLTSVSVGWLRTAPCRPSRRNPPATRPNRHVLGR